MYVCMKVIVCMHVYVFMNTFTDVTMYRMCCRCFVIGIILANFGNYEYPNVRLNGFDSLNSTIYGDLII